MFEATTNEHGRLVITMTGEDGTVWFIPEDEQNADYQAYLAYLAEQETAK